MSRMAPIFIIAAALSSGCVVHVTSDSDALEFDEPITALVTDLGSGDVTITGADLQGAEVYRAIEWAGSDRPALSAWVEDGVLYLVSQCNGMLFCSVNHEVIVSQDIWADITTGSGEIQVKGLDQGIYAETGSGNIALTNIVGASVLTTGSGDIDMQDVIGDIDLSTGSGDIAAQRTTAEVIVASTGSGDVSMELGSGLMEADISTGSGDVDLQVPAGTYAVDISTGSGDVDISGITQSSSSDRWLEVDTGSGDVTLTGQ